MAADTRNQDGKDLGELVNGIRCLETRELGIKMERRRHFVDKILSYRNKKKVNFLLNDC